MSENVFEGQSEASSSERPRAFDTIFFGGLVVGILDALFAFTFYGLVLGVKPLRIFQAVAAGLLGSQSYSGGSKLFCLVFSFTLLLPHASQQFITWQV